MDLVLEFAYAAGAVVCHQIPERSFFVDGWQLPVCARCTGLYLGALAGLVAWCAWKLARGWKPIGVSHRVAIRIVVAGAIPTALSVTSGALSIWDGSNMTRAVLALPLGLSAGAVVASVFTKDLR
ncbi:MAG TPA: DUF2085 domain-containing protein [Vicinamibacterales bacterium]